MNESETIIVQDENGAAVEIKIVYDPHFFDYGDRLDIPEHLQ